MSSNLLLMEPMGGSFERFLPFCCTVRCERTFRTMGVTIGSRCRSTFCTMGVTIGSGRAAQVVAAGGLGLPGSYGPSLTRIEFDNWDFLSRCLFVEK